MYRVVSLLLYKLLIKDNSTNNLVGSIFRVKEKQVNPIRCNYRNWSTDMGL